MSPPPSQVLGRAGERLAAEHLERLGFRILDRNHRTRSGELDLVARRGRLIVFAEVKTRSCDVVDPFAAITFAKQRRLRRLAAAWLGAHPCRLPLTIVRFDAVAVIIDRRGKLLSLDHREDVM